MKRKKLINDKGNNIKKKKSIKTLEKSYESTFRSRDKSTSENSDVFVGVTFKHNARYYISGIGSKSTKEGIVRYIESRGAVVLPYLTSYCLNQNFLEGD